MVGKSADGRADIFSFGAVIYDLLTGERALTGTSSVDTLAAVLRVEPEWAKLPKIPEGLQRLLVRCLTKDRTLRLQAIGEARIVLANLGSEAEGLAPTVARRPWLAWAITADAEVIVTEQPSTVPSQPFTSAGLSLGGRQTWSYVFEGIEVGTAVDHGRRRPVRCGTRGR